MVTAPLPAKLLTDISGRRLLTTVFGDALLPRKQTISVKALARLVAPFGVNERLTRTSLQRMTTDGFVEAERIGRESFYQVAEGAIETFDRANSRIYPTKQPEWDDQWTIAVLDSDVSADTRQHLRRELGWLGVRELSHGSYVSPNVTPPTIAEVSSQLGASFTILMRATLDVAADLQDRHIGKLVDPEGDLTERYESYAETLRRLDKHAIAHTADADAFAIRTLLIDSWRRLALRSPSLPSRLLPAAWNSENAIAKTAMLYRSVFAGSERYLDTCVGKPPISPISPFE